MSQVPDAAELAAALSPTDESLEWQRLAGEAIARLRADLLEAERHLFEAHRASNRAREALLRHQERPK